MLRRSSTLNSPGPTLHLCMMFIFFLLLICVHNLIFKKRTMFMGWRRSALGIPPFSRSVALGPLSAALRV